jgi:hypothetical protein
MASERSAPVNSLLMESSREVQGHLTGNQEAGAWSWEPGGRNL